MPERPVPGRRTPDRPMSDRPVSEAGTVRRLEVGAGRLARWCDGFAVRHGGPPEVARDGAVLRLAAPDGATADLVPPFPLPDEAVDLPGLLAWVSRPRRCGLLLVRRGGYACAVVDTARPGAAAVTSSKVGTRYVQSRTAAGGWSQQRFARRRGNQARELAGAAADVAARVLLTAPASPAGEWLVTGGDRPLVETVLADPRLRALAALPRGPHLDVGDPRSDVVRAVPERLAAVRITLTEPTATA